MSKDISTPAIEQLASDLVRYYIPKSEIAETLRALAAERDAMREALDRMIEAAEIMASGYGRIDGKTPEDEDVYIYEHGHDVILAEAADAARAALKGGAA